MAVAIIFNEEEEEKHLNNHDVQYINNHMSSEESNFFYINWLFFFTSVQHCDYVLLQVKSYFCGKKSVCH